LLLILYKFCLWCNCWTFLSCWRWVWWSKTEWRWNHKRICRGVNWKISGSKEDTQEVCLQGK